MDGGNRLNVSEQALVDAGMKKNDVISCYFFPREHWQSFLYGGGDSSDVMGKILSQWVLLIIKTCVLSSGTAVENNFLKIRRKKSYKGL